MASSFDLNPAFPDKLAELLNDRGEKIRLRERKFNYQRYAYIYLESPQTTPKGIDDDTTSLFDTYPKNRYVIGQVPSDPKGHLQLYDIENGVRRLKPQLLSVSINQNGGGDIYNSFIREVDISFKAFSLAQMEKIEYDFFRLGSTVEIHYGWIDPFDSEYETGKLFLTVYNFGFSMASDGTFDCTMKGMAGDVFPGAVRAGGLIKLTNDEEIEAMGEKPVNPVDIGGALIAKYKAAFGLDADEGAEEASVDNGELDYRKDNGGSGNVDLFMGAIKNVGDSDGFIGIGGDDPVRTPFTNLISLVYLLNITTGDSSKETFEFGDNIGISPNSAEFGSADPRKYVLPGNMAKYGEENDYKKVLDNNGFSSPDIQNILISINEINQIVQNKGTTVNEQFQPPKALDILQDLSSRIANVTAGLVQLDIKPNVNKEGYYVIENKVKKLQKMEKEKKNNKPFKFVSVGENAMTKSISLESEFDADTMLYMTVGNVKNGNIKLEPLQTVYTDIPDIDLSEDTKKALEEAKANDEEEPKGKASVGKDGIDDAKVNTIRETMKIMLTDPERKPTESTQPFLPFQLSLNVTLDGVDFNGFLMPITVDRLPSRFKSAGVKFLITAIEHSFDGQGGWETNLKTVMTMGGDV